MIKTEEMYGGRETVKAEHEYIFLGLNKNNNPKRIIKKKVY